jgi:deoxyribose-phosphate aldolase
MSNLSALIELADTYDAELPPAKVGKFPTGSGIAAAIDHTLLKPEATPDQIDRLCQEALLYQFASVCINPIFVPLCSQILAGSSVKVCTVIGFPLGAKPTTLKVDEVNWCIRAGASELDMVIPIGLLKSANYQQVFGDIQAVSEASHHAKGLVKVIIETALLTRREKIIACLLSREAGADYVKTSTGFSSAGATLEDVSLMRSVVGPAERMGIKAAGGIRSYADAIAMLSAGATRLGTSAGGKIIQQAIENQTS